MYKIKKAIFPVAGLGTRFLPATKAIPKEMLTVVDKPLIQYAVEEARSAGIEEIIFVTGRSKTAIEDHFDYSIELEAELASRGKTDALSEVRNIVSPPGSIAYVRQQQPLGLGHAVWCARNFIDNEPFAVILADDLIQAAPNGIGCLGQMVDVFQANRTANIIAVEEVDLKDVSKYGIISPIKTSNNVIEANNIVEKPLPQDAPSRYGVIGRYILQPYIMQLLSYQAKGAGGEIQLTDAIAKSLNISKLLGVLFQGTRFDCGSKAGWLNANISVALTRDDLHDDVVKIITNASKI